MPDPARDRHVRPGRTRTTWLLTLVAPAFCIGVWGWLCFGGPAENARTAELREASHCASEARVRMRDELLRAAAGSAPFALVLDGERRVVGPLLGPSGENPDAVPRAWSVAEATARSMLAAGDPAGAVRWFESACGRGVLSAEGLLVFAGVLEDPAPADELLATAEASHAGSWCGPLPFELLVAMVRLRTGVGDPVAAREVFVEACARLAPTALLAVVEQVEAEGFLAGDDVLAWLRAAARSAHGLVDGAGPTDVAVGPGGCALVPWAPPGGVAGSGMVYAVPADASRRTADEVVAELGRSFKGVGIDAPHWHPARWLLRPSTAAGDRLELAARGALALGVLALAAGLVLIWRLGRHELALAQMRQGLVDEVSHELRTPLASLALRSEMLAHGDVPAERVAHYAASIHGDVRRLGEQVERVLEFRRLERGGALRREAVSARRLVARGLCPVRSLLRRRRQTVELDVARDLPGLSVDVDFASRALRNLFENAAKYAPEDSAIHVRATASGDEVRFEVGDRGPGIARDEVRRVFEPFYRSPSNSTDVPGSGLGLAFVEKAARAHAGRVWIEAREGGGARVGLALPAGEGA